jgi:hypothetical protein
MEGYRGRKWLGYCIVQGGMSQVLGCAGSGPANSNLELANSASADSASAYLCLITGWQILHLYTPALGGHGNGLGT